MPSELKRRLADEVTARRSNLNDVAVGILASRFGVPFQPSGRPGALPGEGGAILLRMPSALKDKLTARAAQRGRNTNDLIVETLTEPLAGKEPMPSRNGTRARADDRVRAAIIEVGNSAS